MKRRRLFASTLVSLMFAFATLHAETPSENIGTFDRTAIVIAFYRSPLWAETLRAKMEEQRRAREANDIAKVKELEAWGATQQELAHKQLAGKASITNITDALQPAFREIEKTMKVSKVVPAPYLGRGQTVDLTDALLEWLKVDVQTRRVIREAQKKSR